MDAELSALGLAVSLTGGFLFTTGYNRTRYLVSRAETQRLLFYSGTAAAGLIALSRTLLLVGEHAWPEAYAPLARTWAALVYETPGAATVAGALMLGWFLPHLLNWVDPYEAASAWSIQKWGTQLERLIEHAATTGSLMQVTLKNRKVYIGWAASPVDLHSRESDFRILPALSGYRDFLTMELHLTTYYVPTYIELKEPWALDTADDFEVVIMTDQLVSASLYSLDINSDDFRYPQTSDEVDERIAQRRAQWLAATREAPNDPRPSAPQGVAAPVHDDSVA